MTSRLFRLLPVLFTFTLAFGSAFARSSSIPIVLDTVAIPAGNDTIRVQLLAGIPSGKPGSTGRLLVSVRARDSRGRTLAEFERVEPAPPDTLGDRVLAWTVPGKPGKLEARVRLKTLNDREDAGDADVQMNVPDFSKEPFLVSTPWLMTLRRDSTEVRYRNLPSHVLRSQGQDLLIRFILPQASGDCRVRVVLRRGSQQVSDSTFTQAMRGLDTLDVREDPRRLGGGQYKFQVTISNGNGAVKREGTFQVAIGGVDLLRDPVLVRTVLGYIASGEERLAIETAPEDSLSAVWDRFWKRRDPSPETGSNEALDRFLDRVDQATNRFGGVVPGWRSDRGRILIQHGDPERTERVFDPSTRTDTEIWYYDQRNMSYVFQDAEGFGNYKLTGGQ